jgi:glycosyltransferase involved in cell wall biosynthesis
LAAGVGRPGQYRVIRNGVDVDRFALDRAPEPGRILFLGRLAAQKRPDLALRSLALMERPDAELVFVSDGPDREALGRLAGELGVGERVRFLGYRDDVPAQLARAACVLLSSDYEGMPLTVLEAMAAGAPVVATRVGGVEEALGDAGLIVDPGDAEAVAAALSTVLSDHDAAETLGSVGRRRVREQFTRERMVAETAALYEELARP